MHNHLFAHCCRNHRKLFFHHFFLKHSWFAFRNSRTRQCLKWYIKVKTHSLVLTLSYTWTHFFLALKWNSQIFTSHLICLFVKFLFLNKKKTIKNAITAETGNTTGSKIARKSVSSSRSVLDVKQYKYINKIDLFLSLSLQTFLKKMIIIMKQSYTKIFRKQSFNNRKHTKLLRS